MAGGKLRFDWLAKVDSTIEGLLVFLFFSKKAMGGIG